MFNDWISILIFSLNQSAGTSFMMSESALAQGVMPIYHTDVTMQSVMFQVWVKKNLYDFKL